MTDPMPRQPPSLLLRLARKLPFISTFIDAIAERERLPEPETRPEPAQPPVPQEARHTPTTKAGPPRPEARKTTPDAKPDDAKAQTAPACPHCRKPMILKVARSGAKAGDNFWGCADYPQCRGIRAIFAPLPSQPVRAKRADKRKQGPRR